MRCLLSILLAGACLGQYNPADPLPDETLRLARLRLAASNIFQKLPNFTCTLTIERSNRLPNTRKFSLFDNLRLEVALVDGKELYAWPGSKNFDDRDLADMVGNQGSIGSGDFAGHAKSILLSSLTRLEFEAEETIGGRRLTRWSFHYPIQTSQYVMRIRPLEGPVGYSGLLWADASTHDLVRIEMDINEIPAYLPLQSGRKVITYQRVAIGASSFLLPAQADMLLIQTNGYQSRNLTTFSACRQFTGASTITFDEPPPDSAPATTPVVAWHLPPGLAIELKTTAPLDLSKAAVGDLLALAVSRNAVSSKQVWLPAGASVTARVASIDCGDSPLLHCFAYIRLESFSFPGKQGLLRAAMEMPSLAQQISTVPVMRRWGVPHPPGDPSRPAPDLGAIFVRGVMWPQSFPMLWRTLKEPGEMQP